MDLHEKRLIASTIRWTFRELGLEAPSIVIREEAGGETFIVRGSSTAVDAVHRILGHIVPECGECGGDHNTIDCPHMQIELGEQLAQRVIDHWTRI